MRDFDASWASHDGRKHVRITRDPKDGSAFTDSRTRVWHPQKVCTRKAPTGSVDTTLILTNKTKTQQMTWTGKYPL